MLSQMGILVERSRRFLKIGPGEYKRERFFHFLTGAGVARPKSDRCRVEDVPEKNGARDLTPWQIGTSNVSRNATVEP